MNSDDFSNTAAQTIWPLVKPHGSEERRARETQSKTKKPRKDGPMLDLGKRIRDWNSRRRTVAELNRLSAHELEDIGLTKFDIAAYRRNGR